MEQQRVQLPVELQGKVNGHQPSNSSPSTVTERLRFGNVDCAGKKNVLKRGPKKRGKYHGVSYDRRMKQWRAQITAGSDQKYLGCFKTPEIAAKVYDSWSRRLHGSRATLNFPNGV